MEHFDNNAMEDNQEGGSVQNMTKLYVLTGPQKELSFDLKQGSTYVGRSSDNDIKIEDKTVSRKHLKIVKIGSIYYITDLKSRNGTFFDGNYLAPGLELEIKEGVPIAIGMSVICLGEACKEHMLPFLDSIGLTREIGTESGIFEEHRDKTNQRKLELLYNVSAVLTENLPVRETLQRILCHIFDLLKRVDRGAFILLDPETHEIREIIFRSKKPTDDPNMIFCRNVVNRVIRDREPIAVSDAKTEEDEIADTLKVLSIESVLCVPLLSGSQIIGAIYVDSMERPYGFRGEDLSLFMDLSQRTALAIETARLTSELSEIADKLASGN
jgi:pSer/pThr/pTyr-binding forkhead associated (FHA) protein